MVKYFTYGVDSLQKWFYIQKLPTNQIFREMVRRQITDESIVLNVGCGFVPTLHIRWKCKKVVGIDIDKRAKQNSDIDEAIIGNIEDFETSEKFDLIVCQWVIEHLKNPQECFKHLYGMLKPNGRIIVLTSNRRHYVDVIGSRTPYWFNQWFYKFLNAEEEAYPVYLKSNTPKKLLSDMESAGFHLQSFSLIEPEPNYLKFSTLTFIVGVMIEKTLSLPIFDSFRRDMLGIFYK